MVGRWPTVSRLFRAADNVPMTATTGGTNLHKQLTGDPGVVASWVTEALQRCAAGDPASALTLGRDLHWASEGDAERERQAHELLVAAYRALGRHNLAGITDAHHRHRDLPQVDVLRT